MLPLLLFGALGGVCTALLRGKYRKNGLIIAVGGIAYWSIMTFPEIWNDSRWVILESLYLVGFSLVLLGLGISTLKIKSLPRWNILPLLISALALLFSLFKTFMSDLEIMTILLFGLSWVLLGYTLFIVTRHQGGVAEHY
jgi:hypothetical protein